MQEQVHATHHVKPVLVTLLDFLQNTYVVNLAKLCPLTLLLASLIVSLASSQTLLDSTTVQHVNTLFTTLVEAQITSKPGTTYFQLLPPFVDKKVNRLQNTFTRKRTRSAHVWKLAGDGKNYMAITLALAKLYIWNTTATCPVLCSTAFGQSVRLHSSHPCGQRIGLRRSVEACAYS